MARSSLQYRPTRKDDDALRLALIRLAKQYGRYDYRKVTELLRIAGWKINHKKVERFWREEGLQLPQRHKKRRRLYQKDSSIIRMRPTYPNHVWAIDFVHDNLSNGRSYKMLTVLDEYTRQELAGCTRPDNGPGLSLWSTETGMRPRSELSSFYELPHDRRSAAFDWPLPAPG